VGGERWWQVRGLDGIDAEWITEREYLSPVKSHVKNTRKMSDNDKDIPRMEHLETVMVCLSYFPVFTQLIPRFHSFTSTEVIILCRTFMSS
jgi:hypothetical protein